jgi:hypothetical protein
MTRKSMVSQADLKRMALIAVEHDVCVEIEVGEAIVRVMPSGTRRVTRGDPADDNPLPDDFAL